MTMLSFTYNHDFPVILGDILITNNDGGINFSMPTHLKGIPKIIDSKSIEISPIDLRQKLYIINERLSVALGGRIDQMYSFLNSLQAFFTDRIPSITELEEFLKGYDKEKSSNLAALIILASIEQEKLIFVIKTLGNWQKERHPEFDHIFAIGSGANDYLTTARKYNGGIGHTNPFNKSLVQSLDLLSKFLGFESYTAETILNKWGAGFEMVYFFNDRFKKLDDYTFILFNGTYDDNQGLNCRPYSVLKYKYYDELFVIRAADNKGEKLFKVLPINKEKQDYDIDISKPDYHSKNYILGYIIKLPNGKLYAPTFIFLIDILKNVKVEVLEGHLKITVKEWLNEHIENEIKKELRK